MHHTSKVAPHPVGAKGCHSLAEPCLLRRLPEGTGRSAPHPRDETALVGHVALGAIVSPRPRSGGLLQLLQLEALLLRDIVRLLPVLLDILPQRFPRPVALEAFLLVARSRVLLPDRLPAICKRAPDRGIQSDGAVLPSVL